MAQAEQITGTRDITYDLLSVLYHTLQSAETIIQYIQDAEQSNDQELVRFFREVQEQDRERAERTKVLLRDRLLASKGATPFGKDQDIVDEQSKQSFPASDPPMH